MTFDILQEQLNDANEKLDIFVGKICALNRDDYTHLSADSGRSGIDDIVDNVKYLKNSLKDMVDMTITNKPDSGLDLSDAIEQQIGHVREAIQLIKANVKQIHRLERERWSAQCSIDKLICSLEEHLSTTRPHLTSAT